MYVLVGSVGLVLSRNGLGMVWVQTIPRSGGLGLGFVCVCVCVVCVVWRQNSLYCSILIISLFNQLIEMHICGEQHVLCCAVQCCAVRVSQHGCTFCTVHTCVYSRGGCMYTQYNNTNTPQYTTIHNTIQYSLRLSTGDLCPDDRGNREG